MYTHHTTHTHPMQLNLFKSRMSRSAEKRDSGRRLTKIRRTSSEQMVAKDEDHVPAIQESPLVPYTRNRSNTFTNGGTIN